MEGRGKYYILNTPSFKGVRVCVLFLKMLTLGYSLEGVKFRVILKGVRS